MKRSKCAACLKRRESEPTPNRTLPIKNKAPEVSSFSLFAKPEAQGTNSRTKQNDKIPTNKSIMADGTGPNSRSAEDDRYHDAGTNACKSTVKSTRDVGVATHGNQNKLWTHLKTGVYNEFTSRFYSYGLLGNVPMITRKGVEERNVALEMGDLRHLETIKSYDYYSTDSLQGLQDTIDENGGDIDLIIPEYPIPGGEAAVSQSPTGFENLDLEADINIHEEVLEPLEHGDTTTCSSRNKQPRWAELEQYNPKAFKRMKKLGAGLLGTVYKAKERVSGNRMTVALKVQSKSEISTASMGDQISREMRLHRDLAHPNVVELYGSFEDSANIYLALEYMAGGDLFEKQRKKRAGRFEEAEAARYVGDVARGLAYCHSAGVIHRDVKPENLLLDRAGRVKLADFGWATDENLSREYCGTLDYMSREIITEAAYGTDVDAFALGVCAFEFLTGHPAFEREDEREGEYKHKTMQRIIAGEYEWPENLDISKDAKHLVDGLLAREVRGRFTMDDVLNHRWVRKYAV